MKVALFISGKITGDPNYREKFAAAEANLSTAFDVVNPAILPTISSWNWDAYMHISTTMLQHCAVVYMLSDWQESDGAKMEHAMATALNLIIVYESETKIKDRRDNGAEADSNENPLNKNPL